MERSPEDRKEDIIAEMEQLFEVELNALENALRRDLERNNNTFTDTLQALRVTRATFRVTMANLIDQDKRYVEKLEEYEPLWGELQNRRVEKVKKEFGQK